MSVCRCVGVFVRRCVCVQVCVGVCVHKCVCAQVYVCAQVCDCVSAQVCVRFGASLRRCVRLVVCASHYAFSRYLENFAVPRIDDADLSILTRGHKAASVVIPRYTLLSRDGQGKRQ